MQMPLVPLLLASASPVAAVPSDPPVLTMQEQAGPIAETPPSLPAEGDADIGAAVPEAESDVIIVEGAAQSAPGDPLLQVNETAFNITQSVDQAVVGPVAEVYEDDIPKPLRNGLRNFLRNLLEPVNALNFLLQLKPGKALEAFGRLAVNSTIGLGGLVDVASRPPFNMPWRRNGLANTLGYYGVGPGPFLVLPLIGATTLRDLVGSTVDQAVVPSLVGAPFNTAYYAVPAYTINSLQFRMEFNQTMEEIRDSIDPYEATREFYLCSREAEIAALRNRPPPRDCRIDALMGELDDQAPAASLPLSAEPQADASTAPQLAPLPLDIPESVALADAG
jgi:phospholipid-binding lipoprotein MlaA